jgi:phosphatidylglycerol lysyltransferase
MAATLTCLNYVWATGYDLAAMRHLGRRMRWQRVVRTAFVANALANNIGNGLMTGSAVRYWSYARAGLSGAEIARLIVFGGVSFWLGHLLLAVVILWQAPWELPSPWRNSAVGSPSGMALGCLVVLAGYAAVVLVNRARPQALARKAGFLRPPSPGLAISQLALGAGDLLLMATVFGAIVHGQGVPLPRCVLVMLAGVVAGNLSLVPGGLGVFEYVVVLLLGNQVPQAALAADLLVYRLVYFVGPLAAASVLALGMGVRKSARHSP